MTHLARSGHTVAKPRSAVVTAALKSLTAGTFISPHATAAQEVGLVSTGRTLQTTAKKDFTGTREHGAAKKAANGELAAAKTSGKKLVVVNDKAMAKKDGGNKAGIKSDGHHGTLRVQHHIAQRGSAGVSFHHRLARDD